MKLPVSTEWLLHCATSLAQLKPGDTASAAQLAQYYDLPAAYLAKQLQALVRAGVLSATTGPRGGFRLARPASEITLLQIVEAVDGTSSPYECREIRQQGRGRCPRTSAGTPASSPRRWPRHMKPGGSASRPPHSPRSSQHCRRRPRRVPGAASPERRDRVGPRPDREAVRSPWPGEAEGMNRLPPVGPVVQALHAQDPGRVRGVHRDPRPNGRGEDLFALLQRLGG